MMKRLLAACAGLLTATISAQGLTFASSQSPWIRFYATNVPTMLDQWPQTALSRLFSDEDALAAGRHAVQTTADALRRKAALRRAGLRVRAENRDEALNRQLLRSQEAAILRLLEMPVEEVQSAELVVTGDPELGQRGYPRILRTMTCRPRFEGRWSKAFAAEAQLWRASGLVEAADDGKIGSFPAAVFDVPEQLRELSRMISPQRWMLHLPGQFFYGEGRPEEMGAVGAAPTSADAEIGASAAIATLMAKEASGQEIPLFDLHSLTELGWSARFADAMIHTTLRADYRRDPQGLVRALVRGEAPLPAQTLPGQPLAQLRLSLDLPELLGVLAEADEDFALPAPLRELLEAACTGGVAIGCCAPPPGGLIPRLYVTADLADAASLQQLLGTVLPEGTPVKKRRFGDVEAVTLLIPDAPQGLQPTYCIADGQLHVAESPLSMRALLKARGGAPAMDLGDVLPPAGAGEVLPNIDLRFDAAAVYENFYERWLPIFTLANGYTQLPLLARDDLPEPEVVREHLGKGRGVLRRDGNSVSLVQTSASGGLELTALMFTWPTMLVDEALRPQYDDWTIHKSLASQQLETAHAALQRFELAAQRPPKDLEELFFVAKLTDDALWIPADSSADVVKLRDGREVRSSYRYYPTPLDLAELGANMVPIDGGGLHQGSPRAVLLEIQPGRRRMALMDDGSTPVVSGPASKTPIDQLGVEKKR